MAMPLLMIHVGISIERMFRHNYIETTRNVQDLKKQKRIRHFKRIFHKTV